MKVALVHDYLLEYGGAERVLRVLSDMYPEAPIYTAFAKNGSPGKEGFKDREIVESKWAWLLKLGRLYSPLRFLLPWVWRGMDLSEYDVVITSCSSYVARGFKVRKGTKVIAYCHTPPRHLYGYRTSLDWRKYWWAKMYGVLVNTPLRVYDYKSAQEVDVWLANSENVKKRVEKFYRREAKVVYPPVKVERLIKKSEGIEKKDYCLMVSRLVGAKGLEYAVELAESLDVKLKIVGEAYGYTNVKDKLAENKNVELLGRVSDEELIRLYVGAKVLWALAKDEDFGMTLVEAQACGTPVIAFRGGGYEESVVGGETGVFVNEVEEKEMKKAMKEIEKKEWKRKVLQENARRFSRERFEREIKKLVMIPVQSGSTHSPDLTEDDFSDLESVSEKSRGG